jgi:HEAT repeat protein
MAQTRFLITLIAWFTVGLSLTSAQIPFEQLTSDLASKDPSVRIRAIRLLRDAAYPEAALPLAQLVVDANDQVQLEAIAAEMSLFLTEEVVTRKRVGLVVEVRNSSGARAAFDLGPLAIGPRQVPLEALVALRTAARDPTPRVALEALYGFGTLGVDPAGAARRELLRIAGPDLAALATAPDSALKLAAIQVIGRLFEVRPQDDAVPEVVGDAVVAAANENDRAIRGAGMQAIGALRYQRGLKALTDLLQFYGRGTLAESALDAIARIAHPSSGAILETELASKSSGMKVSAIEGLARIGDSSKAPDIRSALVGEKDDAVMLASTFASARLSDGLLDPIAEALRRPNLASQAKQYLAELSYGRSGLISRYAQDPDPLIRAGIADSLAVAYDPAALPIVEALTQDREPKVALAAARAVSRLTRSRMPR